MKFLEKDLEQIIHEASVEELGELGLFLGTKTKRQVRIGKYGIADIVGMHVDLYDASDPKASREVTFTVCELKQNNVSISAFLQALRYAKGINRYIKTNKKRLEYKHKIRIVLIGKSLPVDCDLIYLTDFLSWGGLWDSKFSLEIFTYDYSINGIKFKRHENYKLRHEGF